MNTFIVPIIRHDNIGKFIETLEKHAGHEYYLFIIDQTGSDESYNKYKDKAHLWIRPYRNLGFAKAMNTGIVLSQTPYVTLANDDIEFMNKKWWQGIIDTFDSDPKIIAVNPMSPKEGAWGYGLRADNKDTWTPPQGFVTDEEKYGVYPQKPDGSGFLYKEEFSEEDYTFLTDNHPNWKKDSVCDAIAMWCTVFNRKGLQEIGLIDERFYPGGGEDYDMDARAYCCAWPEDRVECDEKYHRRMVGTSRSWVWHKWSTSRKIDSSNSIFSRPRWNNNDELWPWGFDVWGHHTDENGKRTPYHRVPDVHIDDL